MLMIILRYIKFILYGYVTNIFTILGDWSYCIFFR